MDKTDLPALYLCGTYCHKTGTRPQAPRQQTMYAGVHVEIIKLLKNQILARCLLGYTLSQNKCKLQCSTISFGFTDQFSQKCFCIESSFIQISVDRLILTALLLCFVRLSSSKGSIYVTEGSDFICGFN